MSHKTADFFESIFFRHADFRRCRSIFTSFSTMTIAGPPNQIAAALAAMEACDGRVNVTEFARVFSVPRETLRDAWRGLINFQSIETQQVDEFQRNLAHHRVEARGRHSNRALTDQEEALVVQQLREQYPQGFNDGDVRTLCHASQHESRFKPTQLSRSFITAFKHRHGVTRSQFRSRSRTLEAPAESWDDDVEAACEFIEKFDHFAATISPHLIVNVDETPAYVKNAPSHANHFANSPRPWQWIRASSRQKVTVLASITAAGSTLKPTIVAKGRTQRCEINFAKLAKRSAFLQHTESGLTTSQSFVEFIEAVIVPHTKDQPSLLVLDQWPAHLTQSVQDCCSSHHISLLEVPARATSVLQPLDVGVFGVAKKKIGAQYKESMFLKIWTEDDKWESTIECVRALLRVDAQTVLRAWQLVFPNFINELKKRNMEYWTEKNVRNPMI
jgi:transposase-like protein